MCGLGVCICVIFIKLQARHKQNDEIGYSTITAVISFQVESYRTMYRLHMDLFDVIIYVFIFFK